MLSFNKIKDLLKKEVEEAEAPTPVDNDDIPPPVQVAPPTPKAAPARKQEEPTSAFAMKPPGDTQELADDEIAEQMDGLRRTLEADAFERTEATAPKEQVPFGNNPPTIEMERPDLRD